MLVCSGLGSCAGIETTKEVYGHVINHIVR